MQKACGMLRQSAWGCLCGFGLALIAGCNRAPQLETANRVLLGALQTAVSAKNSQWLDATIALIEQRYEEGDMSDAERSAFDKVVDLAKSGDWKQAQKASFAFSEGQRATSEDLTNLQNRTARASRNKRSAKL